MLNRNDMDSLLEEVLPRVQKPARYTGGELNSITKDPSSVRVRYAVAFPDAYEIGMSNLACSIIYHLLNSREDCSAERVYAPWPDMEAEMRRVDLPLFTLESRTPLAQCDLIGFALSFELGYTNLLNMLDLAGIPVRTTDRDEAQVGGRAWPIVFAGGHCTFNPEPMAPFVDVFIIGEAEEVLVELHEVFLLHRSKDREGLLLRIAQIPGCYVPRFYEPIYSPGTESSGRQYDTMPHLLETRPLRDDVPRRIVRRLVWDVDALPYPTSPIIPFIEVVHDRISLEVMRGCTRGCRFCQAGMITRPVREKSPRRLMQLAEELIRNTGHEDVSLVSLSTADYTRVRTVVTDLIAQHAGSRVGVSLPSLRADRDCVELVQEINKVRKTGLTFAPEAGSQRLRNVTNKGVTEENLFDAADAAFQNGWQRIKLYFMVSLPTETDDDVLAIGQLAAQCAAIARKHGVRAPIINIGVSAFVPKPNTPWQWHGQDTREEIDRKQKLLKRSIRDRAVAYRPNDASCAVLEAALSLGDRRVAAVIERAWRAGARFDAWDEYLDMDRWMSAFEQTGVDVAFYAHRMKAHEEALAWDHIDCGVSKAYLRAEDKRSRAEQLTPDCHTAPCTFCNACDRGLIERAAVQRGADLAERQAAVLRLTAVE
ncbi:MAG: TIGR03960 family B12-binding radical SAM protein [Armatimonadetes bacterium]|nr:TIGR03960 family B12-binding radical SAM protein [Armatimonadota bacterium]MDE2208011.1 TIGR03960 family B12-binding radical SAM protein [Armatimonadota bacterium]